MWSIFYCIYNKKRQGVDDEEDFWNGNKVSNFSVFKYIKKGRKTIEFLIKGLNPNNECKNEKMQPGRFTNTPTIEY